MSDAALEQAIEAAWENRADLNPATKGAAREAVEAALGLLDSGKARVATKGPDGWTVHQWLKKAVLLSFRLSDNQIVGGGPNAGPLAWDKVPLKTSEWSPEEFRAAGFRQVPGAVVRRGAFVAKNVILMPSFVNIGAFVDEGTMVDT